MQYLKHLNYLDTNTNWLTEQFIIIAKNSCLIKKNGRLKSGLFQTDGIQVKTTKDNTSDLLIRIKHSEGYDLVAEYGLTDIELKELIAMYGKHGSTHILADLAI